MTPKEISAYAKVCHKQGIRSLKIGNVEITIEPGYRQPVAVDAAPEIKANEMSEEEILTWSVT